MLWKSCHTNLVNVVVILQDPFNCLLVLIFALVQVRENITVFSIIIYILLLIQVGFLLWSKYRSPNIGKLLLYILSYVITLECELVGKTTFLLISSHLELCYWSLKDVNFKHKNIYTALTLIYRTIRLFVLYEHAIESVLSTLLQLFIVVRVSIYLRDEERGDQNYDKTRYVKESNTQKDLENQLKPENFHLLEIASPKPHLQYPDPNVSNLKTPTHSQEIIRQPDLGFRFFKQLVDILPDGVILIQEQHKDQRIIYSNRFALQAFQATDDENLRTRMDKKVLKRMDSSEKQIGNKSLSSFDSSKFVALWQQNSIRHKKSVFLDANPLQQIPLSPFRKGNNISNIIPDRKISETLDQELTLKKRIAAIWSKAIQRDETELRLKLESTFMTQSEADQGTTRDYEIDVLSGYFSGALTLVLLIRDVTHRNYIKMLKKQNRHKSDTLSFVSHEYRTPLNCIIEMLQNALEQPERNLIKCALDNSRYLHNLSNDLLDHAQLRVGKFQVNFQEFDLRKLAQECLEMFQLMASNKSLRLDLVYDKSLRFSPQIVSDPNRVKQIIVNLISNAFKFTLRGSITLQVRQISEINIEISVMDTGIGIRDQDKQKLFKAFGKIQNKENDIMNKTGVGLGLLISHQLAQLLSVDGMTGLQMESEFKKGARFWFNLKHHGFLMSIAKSPSIKDEKESNRIDDENNSDSGAMCSISQMRNLDKPRFIDDIQLDSRDPIDILIVDDNQFNIDILKMKLKKLSICQVDYTISGLLAEEMVLKRFEEQQPSYKIIFMDLEMPVQNGWTTAKNIMAIYQRHKQIVKMIACSGYSSEEEQDNCLTHDFDGYLVKPVGLVDLSEILRLHYH